MIELDRSELERSVTAMLRKVTLGLRGVHDSMALSDDGVNLSLQDTDGRATLAEFGAPGIEASPWVFGIDFSGERPTGEEGGDEPAQSGA